MSSTSSAHWGLYPDAAAHADHAPSSAHYSYSSIDAARANPTIPRRMSYHSPTESSSPFAYSPPNTHSTSYSSASYSVPSYNNSSSSPTLYSNNPSSYSSSHSLSSTTPSSTYYGSSYTAEPATSSLEYSNSASINPAYIGGRQNSQSQSQPSPQHAARPPVRSSSGNEGVQGVLYPARTEYTDDATVRETTWLKRQCHVCRATSPPGWRKSVLKQGKIVCNACGLYEKTHHRPRPTRLSDESRNGVHRRVSSSASYTPELPSTREGYAQPPSQSQPQSSSASRSPVQYAAAYPSTTTAAPTSAGLQRQGSGPTPPGRSSGSISSASNSRSPSRS